MYNFGFYHWRERLRSLGIALGMLLLATVLWRREKRGTRTVAIMVALASVFRGVRPISKLLIPAPWALERHKYDALAAELPFEEVSTVLDIGCGTGRSLVGLAPHIPESCSVVGLDVFDDRIILGNAPLLARRNARKAGTDVAPVRGDAARLPLTAESQGIVTACRVLHDLPEESGAKALREIHRVCSPRGVLGILELPITPEETETDPETYWRERVTGAGFSVETVKRVERKRGGEPYLVLRCRPRGSTASKIRRHLYWFSLHCYRPIRQLLHKV